MRSWPPGTTGAKWWDTSAFSSSVSHLPHNSQTISLEFRSSVIMDASPPTCLIHTNGSFILPPEPHAPGQHHYCITIDITTIITILFRCPWATARLFHSRFKVLEIENHLQLDYHRHRHSTLVKPLSSSFLPSCHPKYFWLFCPVLFVKTCRPCSIQTPFFSYSLLFAKPLFIGRATTWPTSGSTFTSGRYTFHHEE